MKNKILSDAHPFAAGSIGTKLGLLWEKLSSVSAVKKVTKAYKFSCAKLIRSLTSSGSHPVQTVPIL